MRTNKFVIKASVAAVASVLAAGAAWAGTVNKMDVTTATHNTYASELTYNAAGPIPVDAATQVNTKLGFGVANGSTRYIRLGLSNSTFATAFSSVSNQPSAGQSFTVVQGGAAGDNYAIVQFTAGTGLDATLEELSFGLPGLTATSTGSSIVATYGLYETAVSAVAATSPLYSNSKTIAAFSSGLQFTLAASASTATVADLFKKFNSNLTTKLGTVTYGLASTPPYGKTANTTVTLLQLVTTGNVVIGGDFGAINTSSNGGIFYGTGTLCGTGSTAATTVNSAKTSATFTTTTGLSAQDICYTVTGTTAVPAQTTTAALTVTAATGSSAASVAAANFGTIVRDGASVIALNLPAVTNVDAGYIRITNAGSTAGKITGTVYAEDGSVLGTANTTMSASLAANATQVLSMADLKTMFGITSDWTGRAKLQLIGEISSSALKVQNLVRTSNGTLVNVSGSAASN